MGRNKKNTTIPGGNLPTLRIGSRVRCTDDGVTGRIVWTNGVSVKIKWDDGEQVTWKRDSLATRPIEILDGEDDQTPAPADAPAAEPTTTNEQFTAAAEATTATPEQPQGEPETTRATAEPITTEPAPQTSEPTTAAPAAAVSEATVEQAAPDTTNDVAEPKTTAATTEQAQAEPETTPIEPTATEPAARPTEATTAEPVAGPEAMVEPATPGTDGEAALTAAKPKRQRKTSAEPKEKKVSALGAAAQVLAEEARPMTCKEMIAAMAAKGYWTSPGGQTPDATLYIAIAREITVKGAHSRFQKTARGQFARTPAA